MAEAKKRTAKKAVEPKEEIVQEEVVNPRLAEIDAELKAIAKKRLDFTNYMNSTTVGHKILRAYSYMKQTTFRQEQALKKERAEILKGVK